MRNRAYHISLFIVMLCIHAISYAFKWPLKPQDRPHHITATFGEYRPPYLVQILHTTILTFMMVSTSMYPQVRKFIVWNMTVFRNESTFDDKIVYVKSWLLIMKKIFFTERRYDV